MVLPTLHRRQHRALLLRLLPRRQLRKQRRGPLRRQRRLFGSLPGGRVSAALRHGPPEEGEVPAVRFRWHLIAAGSDDDPCWYSAPPGALRVQYAEVAAYHGPDLRLLHRLPPRRLAL